jgi:hypothetical protein
MQSGDHHEYSKHFDHVVTCSNWVYFIPIVIVLFLFSKYPNIHILIALLIITLLTSTSYHICRGSGDKLPENHVCEYVTPVCRACRRRSTLYELRDGDYGVAILTALLIFLTVVPLKTWVRIGYFALCLLWLVVLLDSTEAYSDSHMTLLCAPLIPIMLIVVFMPILFKTDTLTAKTKRFSWILSIVAFLIAVLCFQNTFGTPYHTHHCNWHYFSALAMALLLYATQQNQDHINLRKLDDYGLRNIRGYLFIDYEHQKS